MRQRGLAAVERAFHAYAEHGVPLSRSDICEQLLLCNARIIDKDVRRPQRLLYLRKHRAHRRFVRDICTEYCRRAARSADTSRHAFGTVPPGAAAHGHTAPLRRQRQRCGCADAAGSSCHDCGFFHFRLAPISAPAAQLFKKRRQQRGAFVLQQPALHLGAVIERRANRSVTLPQQPAFDPRAPYTTRLIQAVDDAPAHMGHGSSVTNNSHCHSRQPPKAWHAASMASSSA